MKILYILIIASQSLPGLATGLYAAETMPGHEHSAPAFALTDAHSRFLSGYESVRAALAADDLAAATSAASVIADSAPATELAKVQSLKAARVAFKKLSNAAVSLAKGQAGYFVVNCPMAKSDWVQTTTKISNPYLGKKMPTCGNIKN